MKLEKQIAIAASMTDCVRRLEALITEAMQHMYASHVEKTQMRLAPVKLMRKRTQLYRGWWVLEEKPGPNRFANCKSNFGDSCCD